MTCVGSEPVGADMAALGHSWIDGCAHPSGGPRLSHVDPKNGECSGQTDDARDAVVEAAVHSARDGFVRWTTLASPERQRILLAFADRIEAQAHAIAALEALEVGRPIADATAVVMAGAAFLRSQAMLAEFIGGDLVGADDQRLSLVWRKPRGVVLAITPWNVPISNVLSRAAPALAAGNAVIVKPSENCPRSAVLLAKIASDAGMPAGVFNIVLGDGQHTGALLSAHAGIDMVAFTGSTATGREIIRMAASQSLKPVLLECGGKSPSVILEDVCGVDALWRALFRSAFWNTGQLCVARTRLMVPRGRMNEAIDGLTRAAADWPCGDPSHPATRLGPLASPRQFSTVMGLVEEARAVGELIELPCPDSGRLAAGSFLLPQLALGVPHSSAVWREEIFGPVAVLQPYDDVSEAIALANDTRYGLAATVWTNSARDGYRLARSIEAGIVEICASGESAAGWSTLQYFEPFKQSGLGVDGGLQGLNAYTLAQSVSFSH